MRHIVHRYPPPPILTGTGTPIPAPSFEMIMETGEGITSEDGEILITE